METCIYRVTYEYHSTCSFAFDNSNAVVYVEARKNIWRDELEKLCQQKFKGFRFIRGFEEVYVHKLG